MNSQPLKATAKGPINIALIKYWGKNSEELITPLNNSISLTLDTNTFYTQTTVTISPSDNNKITLTINNEHSEVTKRILSVIEKFKAIAKLTTPHSFLIQSINTFPTASGCASSASSMAALVTCLDKALNTQLTKEELSSIARLGSGSACRSIFGGIVEWEKDGGEKSHSVQLYDEDYWKLKVMLIIVDNSKKEVSSSKGMQLSKETSEFMKYRVEHVVQKHLKEAKTALKEKIFESLGRVIMKDTNNFHAVCRDTFPTINYLNAQSEFIIKCVNEINHRNKKIICAYSFDAGANAFVIYEEKNEEIITSFFNKVLKEKEVDEDLKEFVKFRPDISSFKQEVIFQLGKGPQIIN